MDARYNMWHSTGNVGLDNTETLSCDTSKKETTRSGDETSAIVAKWQSLFVVSQKKLI